jgi:hypothetical protein
LSHLALFLLFLSLQLKPLSTMNKSNQMHTNPKIIRTLLYSYSALHVSGTLAPIIRRLLILHIQLPVTVCRWVGCVFQLRSATSIPGQSRGGLWLKKWCWYRIFSENFVFSLSVPFHQCYRLFFIYTPLLPERKRSSFSWAVAFILTRL